MQLLDPIQPKASNSPSHSIIRYIHKFGKWQLSVESVEVEWGYSRFPEVLCLNEYIRT